MVGRNMRGGGYEDREEVEVLRLRADPHGNGPAEAMRALESRLPSSRGRAFYGTFQLLPEGEEYYACVERVGEDDPGGLGLESGTIPGGLYACRRIRNWRSLLAEGRLGRIFDVMVLEYRIDLNRPFVEYYRGTRQLDLLFPVLARDAAMD